MGAMRATALFFSEIVSLGPGGTSKYSTRTHSSILAIHLYFLPTDHREHIAPRLLHKAGRSRGQIVDHPRSLKGERREVDQVQIRLKARPELPAIVEAEYCCGVRSLLFDDELQGKPRPADTVSRPMSQHESRHTTITYDSDVCPPVRGPNNGIWVGKHLT